MNQLKSFIDRTTVGFERLVPGIVGKYKNEKIFIRHLDQDMLDLLKIRANKNPDKPIEVSVVMFATKETVLLNIKDIILHDNAQQN